MEKFADQPPLDESFEKPREKRISQKESESRGRKAVIVLFLITLILSLLFWMKTEIPSFFKQLTEPYQEVIEK